MAALLFRMLAMIAIVLMPLAMTGAPAAAQGPGDPAHCSSNEQPQPEPAPGDMQDAGCFACAGLPAIADPRVGDLLVPAIRKVIVAAHVFEGIEPELATPPPRPV